MELNEIAITSDGSNHTNFSIYDLKTGNLIVSHKGQQIPQRCLSIIQDDYVIAADAGTPTVKFWTFSKMRNDTVMTVPGKVTALAVSNGGHFCIAAIDKKIYIWGIKSGVLIKIITCHFQPITCLKFSSDDGIFVSGGEDSLVLVWLLSDHLCNEDKRPRFIWRDHTRAITDIHISSLGAYSRVATASLDMTSRIYDLETGKLVLSVCMEVPLTAVAMDMSEFYLILGAENGSIFRINMYSCDKSEIHQNALASLFEFKGHSKKINCLSVSTFGTQLLSGSDDKMCKFWDISTLSCLKTIRHEGPVTNGLIVIRPHSLLDEQCLPSFSLREFKRSIVNDEQDIVVNIQNKDLSLINENSIAKKFNAAVLQGSSELLIGDYDDTINSVIQLKAINNQMYAHCLNSIADGVFGVEEEL